MADFKLPVIEAHHFLSDPSSPAAQAECRKAADALYDYGCLLIRDPRVSSAKNEEFLDLLERYYAQPLEDLQRDVHPELGYQIGASPEFTEDPKCRRAENTTCHALIGQLPADQRPLELVGPDPKWRFFWRIGDTPPPTATQFPRLNAPPVVPTPDRFPCWTTILNEWGGALHATGTLVAQMTAVGFGLPARTWSDLTQLGPHLLAPTGSDLTKYGALGTVLAGFHYDLNFLTLHGKSRYPGLHIWPRNQGRKIAVQVPDGCILVQTGRQMEWLTGGEVPAGYHEVVVTEGTQAAMARQLTKPEEEQHPLWRVSSTFFLHIASDQVLQPTAPRFSKAPKADQYPPVLTGDYVKAELTGIKLMEQYKE
ncbi:hypothetical protein H4R33_006445 [Dimargaris cristalligena]|nr:hypothetical protein H4R33_006445 [Dimargaris cristalligena]